MKKPYITALNVPFRLLAFVKKLTVSGIIGKTQGVSSARKPPRNPRIMMSIILFPDETIFED